MGENSKIQWTTHTFNPWVGCQKVSDGCKRCYAEDYDRRVGGAPKNQRADPSAPQLRWGPSAARTRTSVSYWRQPLKWNKQANVVGAARPRVFCASLADVYDLHPSIMPEWRLQLFELIKNTPQLDWLLLTKRPENWSQVVTGAIDAFPRTPDVTMETVDMLQAWVDGVAPRNVWQGTTTEDQPNADKRIPLLRNIPAVVRFLSIEPQIGPVDLTSPGARGIHWAIVGGESGHGARPFNVRWAATIVEQVHAVGGAVFVKQLGANPVWPNEEHPRKLADRKGGDLSEFPKELQVRELPVGAR